MRTNNTKRWIYRNIYPNMVGLDRNDVDEVSYYEGDRTPTFRMLSRQEWGGKPPATSGEELLTPLEHVRFTHTDTESCSTHEECAAVLREIQDTHMETYGFDDISYNFMIGGNGYVYEGRGWLLEPERPNAYGELLGKSYEVAYIGSYQEDTPPSKEALKAGMELIVYMTQAKKVHHFFQGNHLT